MEAFDSSIFYQDATGCLSNYRICWTPTLLHEGMGRVFSPVWALTATGTSIGLILRTQMSKWSIKGTPEGTHYWPWCEGSLPSQLSLFLELSEYRFTLSSNLGNSTKELNLLQPPLLVIITINHSWWSYGAFTSSLFSQSNNQTYIIYRAIHQHGQWPVGMLRCHSGLLVGLAGYLVSLLVWWGLWRLVLVGTEIRVPTRCGAWE